jgi:hypothetical protein
MKRDVKRIKNYQSALLILVGIVYLGSRTIHAGKEEKEREGQVSAGGIGYIGSAACKSCHGAITESHRLTAHYRDSRPATKESIKGSFDPGKNHFTYNKFAEVVMESKGDGFWQTAYLNGTEIESEKFGVVIGSGRKGQTYLYWKDERLYQLPVSYYAPLADWCNSPSYPKSFPRFSRPIPAHCIECHGTYAQTASTMDGGTRFTGRLILYGVDCERCHGPGADHVAYHKEHPGERTGKFILDARLMSRQQRLDACALCHSGPRDELKPAFSFQTGDRLDDFSASTYNPDSLPSLDVHGNQYGLLLSSKCYRQSGELDCSSCHNVHVDEAKKPEVFSRRCLNCHNGNDHPSCSLAAVASMNLSGNCIDCHMPALPSQVIFLRLSDTSKSTPDLVRTHRVAIYPASTKLYLEKIKAQSGARVN